jgi:hypothetical protein
MSTELPEAIASYIAGANARDIDAVAACFTEDAVVRDEGQDRRGIAAIREWKEETSRKYQPTFEVIDVAARDGMTVVTGKVSGTFPGSPVELRYGFKLKDGKIARLEIV